MSASRSTRLSPVVAFSATLGAVLASPASATVVDALYGPFGSTIRYQIKFMPDFDQRRASEFFVPGLPGSGSMYCVPTASMNLFAYAANHGFQSVNPGPGNWQSNDLYDDATSAIATLGALMNTHPVDGTGGADAGFGFAIWMTSAPTLTWQTKNLNDSYAPTIENLGALACSGWIVSFVYGRYDEIGTGENGVPLLRRDGGHAVTLVNIKKQGSTPSLGYRDPADSPADTEQSTFKNVVTTYENLFRYIQPPNGGSYGRTVSVLGYPSSDGRYRIVDSVRAVRPLFGLTFFTPPRGEPGVIKKLTPITFAGAVDLSPPEISIPTGMVVQDLDLLPDLISSVLATSAPGGVGVGSIQRLDLLTGAMAPFGDGADLAAKTLTVGRLGDVFASEGDKLYRYDAEGTLIAAISSVPPISALTYDDALDAVTILSVPQRRLVRRSRDMGTLLTNILIPPGVPMAGDGSVTIDPTTGRIWFATSASSVVAGALLNADTGALDIQTIEFAGAPGVTSIRADHTGRLHLVVEGAIRTFVRVDDVWTLDDASPFNGLESGPKLFMLAARSNFQPSLHAGPGHYNIEPDDLVPLGVSQLDCLADLDLDGMVGGSDLGLLLNAWGAAQPGSPFDLDLNGVVDGSDLGVLLNQWGPCP